MDAELDGGLLGLFTGTDERYSASTKLRRIGTGHDYEPSGSGHQLATETGTISVGQVKPVTSSFLTPVRLEVDADRARVMALADRLSELRRVAGIRLSERVTAELSALAMGSARITVEVTAREEYTASGRDAVAILLQPHPGAEPRPLGRGASGGELSRVMLALEVVIAATDPVPTFIFDEVDAGVGGASAIEIGRRLARLAQSAQVIVVTHLAQVAAFAGNHLRVVKDSDGAVTASSVRQLHGEERIAEMARLLSGLPDSESGLAHARELIESARELAAR